MTSACFPYADRPFNDDPEHASNGLYSRPTSVAMGSLAGVEVTEAGG